MDSWAAYNELAEMAVVLVVVAIAEHYKNTHLNKIPRSTALTTGQAYLDELPPSENQDRVYDVVHMPLHTFVDLHEWLLNHTPFDSSKVCSYEKLVMFLVLVCDGHSVHNVAERYQHSSATVHRAFYEVLNALTRLHIETVKQPSSDDAVPAEIESDARFFPYFENCVGALDGTHIHAQVSAANTATFRDRYTGVSQNVLGACTFGMMFCYILPGWEGSAHDARVFNDAVQNKGFVVPDGKYYLADGGYSNSKYTMTPYPKTRYHLREWQKAGSLAPETKEELFNLRHSTLRNVVERIFGVVKRRFKILSKAPEYPFATQVQLMYALSALHNFLNAHNTEEELRLEEEEHAKEKAKERRQAEDGGNQASSGGSAIAPGRVRSCPEMNLRRDAIAERMWRDWLHDD